MVEVAKRIDGCRNILGIKILSKEKADRLQA
jgi:hypothetical protein